MGYLGASATYDSTTAATSHTLSVTAPNGVADPCILVMVGRRTTDDLVTGVTIAGQPLTLLGVSMRIGRAGVMWWSISGASCPNDGTAKTIEVTASSNLELGLVAFVFSDRVPVVGGVAASDVSSASITTAISGVQAGEWLMGAVSGYNTTGTFTPGAGQAEVADFTWSRAGTIMPIAVSYKDAPTGSDSMSQTIGASTDLAQLVIRLAPGAGSASEDHSGAASIAGGGTITALGTKAVGGAASVTGGGTIVATGTAAVVETHSGASTISGGGTIAADGGKGAAGATVVPGGGVLTASGVKTAPGAATIAGGGSLTTAGVKLAIGAVYIVGGGTIEVVGVKHASGAVALSGGGTVAAAGTAEPVVPLTILELEVTMARSLTLEVLI